MRLEVDRGIEEHVGRDRGRVAQIGDDGVTQTRPPVSGHPERRHEQGVRREAFASPHREVVPTSLLSALETLAGKGGVPVDVKQTGGSQFRQNGHGRGAINRAGHMTVSTRDTAQGFPRVAAQRVALPAGPPRGARAR